MYAVEFEAPIQNGVVHIPKEYKDIQDTAKATFVVMYENEPTQKDDEVESQLEEFHYLIAKSNNKIMVTDKLAIDTDEMIDDGLLCIDFSNLCFCDRN